MSDPTRGITDPDMRRVLREAIAGGWEWLGVSGSTHAQIRWPATGVILRFGTTPSVGSWKTTATDIKRESGVQVWRKGNKKRSRKSTAPVVDRQLEAARRKHAVKYEAMLAAKDQARRTRDVRGLMG